MTAPKFRVAIDCDDAAIDLKDIILKHLQDSGADVTDLNYSAGKDYPLYPEIGFSLAQQVASGKYNRGILICGTGLGMAMIANKVQGVLAGTAHDVFSAERLAKSNDGNILTMGARVIGSELAKTIVDAWMRSEFAGGGSTPKVEQMRQLEKESFNQTT